MHIPCTLEFSSEHLRYEFTQSNFGVQTRGFVKGPSNDLILQAYCKRISTLALSFFIEKNYTLNCSIVLQIDIPLGKQSMHLHYIPSIKEEEKEHMHAHGNVEFWKCGTTLSFLPPFYHLRLVRAIFSSLLLFLKAKNGMLKFSSALENIRDAYHG